MGYFVCNFVRVDSYGEDDDFFYIFYDDFDSHRGEIFCHFLSYLSKPIVWRKYMIYCVPLYHVFYIIFFPPETETYFSLYMVS
jgi:hypothetical protein